MATPTSFNGFAVNGATDYRLVLQPAGEQAPLEATLVERGRLYQRPVIDGIQHGPRHIPFVLYLKAGAATTPAAFAADANRYFNPFVRTARPLLATHPDGSTTLTADVYVTNFRKTSFNAFAGVFVIPDGVWRGTTTNSDSSSPTVVAGEYPAAPSLAISMTTGTIRRRRITVTDNCGRGLANYPVAITFDSTGYSASAAANYVVIYAGRSIPFRVVSPDNASTKLWVRLDCPPAGSVTLDIYYGSTVSNSVTADQLDDGGMDLTNSTNTSWVWDAPFTVSVNPKGACGVWTAVKAGRNVSGVSFGIASESGTQLDIDIAPNALGGALANDADAIALVVGTGAGTASALAGLSRDDVNSPTGSYQAFIRYRTANQVGWTTAWSSSGMGAGVTAAVDLDNAVEIVVGIEPADDDADVTLRLALSGTFSLTLNSSLTPTVSVAASVAARLIDGTITNSTTGDTITFDEVYLDDGATLTIDTRNQTITINSGPLHTAGTGIKPSNRAEWFELAVGSNAWSVPSGVTLTLSWEDRYFA